MFRKRYRRLTRLAEEMKKQRSGDPDHKASHGKQARRVSSSDFMSRVGHIRAAGGRWKHGAIQ